MKRLSFFTLALLAVAGIALAGMDFGGDANLGNGTQPDAGRLKDVTTMTVQETRSGSKGCSFSGSMELLPGQKAVAAHVVYQDPPSGAAVAFITSF